MENRTNLDTDFDLCRGWLPGLLGRRYGGGVWTEGKGGATGTDPGVCAWGHGVDCGEAWDGSEGWSLDVEIAVCFSR